MNTSDPVKLDVVVELPVAAGSSLTHFPSEALYVGTCPSDGEMICVSSSSSKR
jgi:hypothetical protein